MQFKLSAHRLIHTLMAFLVGAAPSAGIAQRPVDAESLPCPARVTTRRPISAAESLTPLRAAGRKKATLPRPGQIIQAAHQLPGDPAVSVEDAQNSPEAGDSSTERDPDPLQDLLSQTATPIDLISALQLAGERNPTILLGQQRVVEAVAQRQLAAAQFLPTINLGTSVDSHWGVLQQSTGNILSVRREAVFVGAGANAIAAGTVNIPGVLWTLNVSDSIFNYLVNRQEVDRREFDNRATRQDVLLRVALAYNDLVRSEGERSIAILSRNDARELARITAAYLTTGQGRKPDADRAATELARREALLLEAEGNVVRASVALCQTLHLDPSLRLHAADNQVIPRSIVPEPIPLPELLAIALMYRPELNERRVGVAQSLLALQGAKLLPFSPTVFLGFGAGGFGGGSDLVAQPVTSLPFGRGAPRFSSLDDREDLDVMAYWTLQNLGVGNKALIDAARSRVSSADFELLITLDLIRSEVAAAQARTFARFARVRSCELAITAGLDSFAEDMTRIRGTLGLPLEAVDSLRLLAQSRIDYLDAILDYNQAQFELYVALGKPPSEILIRPAEPSDEAQDAPRGLDAVGRPSQVGRTQRPHAAQRNGSGRPEKLGLPSTDEESEALFGLLREDVLPPALEEHVIDLPTALHLAEAANPTIALGRQAIVEAQAVQMGARGLLLPSLNAGSNYHLHQGVLQSSFGQIRNLTEQALYVGGGARTLAAETVAVPAVRIFSHLGDALIAPLSASQVVCARTYDATAINNDTLLAVVQRYLELAMAEASLDAIHQGEDGMRSIVEATAAFASAGQGREGDFQRARAEALLLHAAEQSMQEQTAVKSAELSRVLHLDPSIRLRTQPGVLEMVQLVDPDYSVEALVDLAQTARPELAARTAEIAAAEYRVRQEVTRPLLPVVSVGFSGGAFGGGGNFNPNQQFFQTFGGRTDFDVMAVWSLQNLGFGNSALQKRTRAERDQAIAARGRMANRISREVGDAFANAEARKRQVALAHRRLRSAIDGAREEIERTRGGEGLPIEALNSVRLLSEAGLALVESVGGYDLAQFELFVAIGQTPHGALPDPSKARSSESPPGVGK